MKIEEYRDRFLHTGTNGLADPQFHEAGHVRASRAAVAFGLGLIAEVLQNGCRLIATAVNNHAKTMAAAMSGQPMPVSDNAAKLEATRRRIEAEARAKAQVEIEAKMAAAEEELASEGLS